MLVTGVYQLKYDVVNVSPDRRKRNDFTAVEKWKKGMLVCVKTYPNSLPTMRTKGMYESLICSEENRSQWESLVNAFEPIEKTSYALRTILDFETGNAAGGDELIARLMELGIATFDQLLEVGRGLGAMPEDEYLEWYKRVVQ